MIDRNQLFSFALLLLTSTMVFGEAARCPANIAPVQYRPLLHSQIAMPVTVNGSGPYDFMVDTGAQVTIIDPALANELKLEGKDSINVIAVTNSARVPLVSAALVETGPVAVHDLQMAVEDLGNIQALNPTLRGILGNNFLSRFDLLIDHSRKKLCFDSSRQMQLSVRGERVQVLSHARSACMQFAEPILISVHFSGDHGEDTILRVDSGSNVPVLFVDRNADSMPWLQRRRMMRGATAGNATAVSYAVTPARTVKLSTHQQMQVSFLTPISDGHPLAKAGEDGLLPTTLFKRVLICAADHFVIFEPQS